MKIRKATPQDSLLLSKLCADVQSLHARHHPHLFKMPQSDDFAASFFNDMLADAETGIFIAEDEKQAIGYIMCRLIERPETLFTHAFRYLLIDQISVCSVAHRKGVGAALMAQAESLAKEWDVPKVQLDSWAFNTGAHLFFEKMGYEKFNHRFWRDL